MYAHNITQVFVEKQEKYLDTFLSGYLFIWRVEYNIHV